ncbi:hypothetical protein MRQ36_22265 [Micromonospora sp. R77]|uniref:hypothetical protein n=1 Tax=Micromonospora sp. R77 TaxID=2925836 RepID=UPI001F61F023|nr:hypothetical protein [Micromonospora sp. R77]MCI4065141.1 hypothetical protein [Micromonospora sp. R77]
MKRPPLPPIVDQTRVFLLTQTWLLLVGLLVLLLLLPLMSTRGPLDDESGTDLAVLLGSLIVTPAVLAVAAKAVRHGWTAGWFLALLAELAVGVVLYAAFDFGLFLGLPALLFVGLGAWVLANLFRADVRRFFFARTRVVSH